MPVIFVGVGELVVEPIPMQWIFLSNPRGIDPCPDLKLPTMTFLTKEQNITILTALQPLMNVREISYMPHWTIVDPEFGDGRVYESNSLPGVVAGRTMLYHWGEERFCRGMGHRRRERKLDPERYEPLGLG
jgi:hypothetical protein